MNRRLVLSALATSLVSCSGSGSGGPTELADTALRIDSARTGGAGTDALAAALLQTTPAQGFRPGRAQLVMTDAALAAQLEQVSRVHLAAVTQGVGAGSRLEGSAYIRRLATVPDAPVDSNRNGSNLDETLQAEHARLAEFAGGVAPAGARPILFGWRSGLADFAGPGDARDATRETVAAARGEVDLAQVGQAMLARVILATADLQRNRGSRPGETPESGVRGLEMLQQVIAMEETLFSQLFTDGSVLGALQFPGEYDPKTEPVRWLPRAIRANDDPTLPGVTGSYGVLDRASTLETVGSMLRVAAELSFFASDSNPNPNLRDVFRGYPFGVTPTGGTGNDVHGIVTWEDGISEIVQRNCTPCHPPSFPSGGYVADSYESVFRPGTRAQRLNLTMIVRGDPDKSLFYQVLSPNPPPPFQRMPQGSSLSQTELDLVRQWILDGARSAPPGPPRFGIDLALVSYKNLLALHLDPSGALYERNEGGAGGAVEFVDVAATGLVLQALAAMAHLEAALPDFEDNLRDIAEFAVDKLTDAQGAVAGGFDIAGDAARGAGGLLQHARLTAGLLAAGRTLDSTAIVDRGKLLGQRLLAAYFRGGSDLFASDLQTAGIVYTPAMLAALVDALREMAAAGMTDAVEVYQRTMRRLARVLAFSEIADTGETVGDGIPDTDEDGIPEPAFAGGRFGRAPLLAGEIKEGPEPSPVLDGPVLWSKHIQPLFRATCASCHLDGAKEGGYRLDTPALLRIKGDQNPSWPIVVPGDPEASYLYRKLVDRVPPGGGQMPLQTPPLDDRGKELVRRWIAEGATSR